MDSIAKLESENAKSIEPLHQAEIQWKETINMMNNMTLFPFTSSWWTGGNIPGKKAEAMTYIGGIEMYEKQCRSAMDGWKGFEVIPASAEEQQMKITTFEVGDQHQPQDSMTETDKVKAGDQSNWTTHNVAHVDVGNLPQVQVEV